jgi:hypothetical protein
MTSPQINGGMTSAEFKQMLADQDAKYQNLIDKQNQASIEAEAARQQADQMQAALDAQKAAADEKALNDAQDALNEEIDLSQYALDANEKANLQSGFNSLFTSFVKGLPTNTSGGNSA